MAKHHRGDINPYEKNKACDPGQCAHCRDLGHGDFLCVAGRFEEPALVVQNWENTQDWSRCRRRGQLRQNAVLK